MTPTDNSYSPWWRSTRADPVGAELADRHYSRRTPGAVQFAGPGRVVVLLAHAGDALWVSRWPKPEYVDHRWPGAWECTIFRNESPGLSSAMIRGALAATRAVWGEPPALGLVTWIDPAKVRRKRDPGRCFLRAGFHVEGITPGGHGRASLLELRIAAEAIPEASPAPTRPGAQLALAMGE
jgi:hypothetical protein